MAERRGAPRSGGARLGGARLPRARARPARVEPRRARRRPRGDRAGRRDLAPLRGRRPAGLGLDVPGHGAGRPRQGRGGMGPGGGRRAPRRRRGARRLHDRRDLLQRDQHVSRPGRLSARQRVGRCSQALVREAVDQRLPRRGPGAPVPGHAASPHLVRLRMGDLAGAEEAFRRANEMGEDPQPGRTMLLLAQGKVDAAASSIRRSLEDQWSKLARARLLPMQAEVAKVAGDPATALTAAEELDAIAEEFGSQAIRAAADWSHGLADLAGGRAADAERRFRRARQGWREIDAPYEAARAGVALAEAHEAEGDTEAARLELETSLAAFERLGATPDAVRTAARLSAIGAAAAGPAVAKPTFLFTHIMGSTNLLEAIGDEAWTDLRRWHDDTLRTCVADHGGEDVDHTGDGFFFAFPNAASAVACAQEIQRRLAEHRRDHGFAPQVRIGMHAAEATLLGENYSGMGVHTAARVGAVAEGGEIVASASTLEGLPGIDVANPREVDLKGIAEPVAVVSIAWR